MWTTLLALIAIVDNIKLLPALARSERDILHTRTFVYPLDATYASPAFYRHVKFF